MSDVFESWCFQSGRTPLMAEQLKDDDQVEMVRSLMEFTKFNDLHARKRDTTVDLEVGFYKSSEFNAVASSYKATDVIAISWGIVTTLRNLFNDIMHFEKLSWIGEDQRDAAATWMYECALLFIFLHELGHVWNGHTSLVKAKGIAFLDEMNAFPDGSLGRLDRQMLEFDADSFAATNMFNYGTLSHPFPSINPSWEQFGDGLTGFVMVAFSLHLLFRIFDRAADFDHEEKRIHPSAPLRQRIIADTLARRAEDGDRYMGALEVALWGMNLAEDAFAFRVGKPRDDNALQAVMGPEGERYIRKLLKHWHIIRPQLDPLKRGGVLPVAQAVEDAEDY